MTGLAALLVLAAPMSGAADAFLRSLLPEQRAKVIQRYENRARTHWQYSSGRKRSGLTLRAMTREQRTKALELLRAVTSERGYRKAIGVMALETEIAADPEEYYVSIFGAPKARGTWGLRFEGHHLSLNYVVADGRLKSATPMFFGANPARVGDKVLLSSEEDLGFALLNALDARQRKRAIVSDRTRGDMEEAGRAQTQAGDPVGLPASDMDEAQRKLLRGIVKHYVGHLPDAAAAAVLKRVPLEQIHFAWYGGTARGTRFSYRIQGPDLLILYFHARFNHAHCVWRTIGHDFGS